MSSPEIPFLRSRFSRTDLISRISVSSVEPSEMTTLRDVERRMSRSHAERGNEGTARTLARSQEGQGT